MYEQAILNEKLATAYAEREVSDIRLEREKIKSTPSYMLRPRVFPDGCLWCALYGNDIQNGVCGFGQTPEEAYRDFDTRWTNEKAFNARK